ncbi:hypothetical protein EJ110_NYTH42685 [Nymphaea thermarum]|nr:hypothetical protein EJ110_NYTH42685 [Nymphaea thermarum]
MAGAGDVAFKVLTGGLGVATIYLTGVCAVNLFRGFSWHTSQPVCLLPSFLTSTIGFHRFRTPTLFFFEVL